MGCMLSAINEGGESAKNDEYLLKFIAKFKKLSYTEKGTQWSPFIKNGGKKSCWTVSSMRSCDKLYVDQLATLQALNFCTKKTALALILT
jgi:hypothetical protein